MNKAIQYVFIALAAILAVTTVIFFNKSENLKKENSAITQNYLAEKDSIDKFTDSISIAYEKLSFVSKDLEDSILGLNGQLQLQVKKIVSLTNAIIELQKEYSSDSGKVIIIRDTITLDREYNYKFTDTSGFINVLGDVQINTKTLDGKHSLVKSIDPFSVKIPVFINKDNNVAVAIQFDNPGFVVKELNSVVTWEALPDIIEPKGTSFWERLGIYGNIGLFPIEDVEVGLVVRPFTLGYTVDTKQTKFGFNTTFAEIFK